MSILNEGNKIKDRKVVLGNGDTVSLSELSGKNGMILYFYPKDNTPGCTTESCNFNDQYAAIKKLGYTIVGVSPDSPESHTKFSDKFQFQFQLISDSEKKLAIDLGVWGEKFNYGKKYMGILRTTFLVDPSLKIMKVYEKVKPAGHAEVIIQDIKEMK